MNHIYHDLKIDAQAPKIFKALSTKDGMEAWWPKIVSKQFALGSEVQFYFTEQYNWKAEVISLEANRHIHFKMIDADEDWLNTLLKFDILQKDDYCILQLSHLNWVENNHHFRRTNYCWAFYLKMIKDYAEQQIIVPFEDRSFF